MSTTARFCRSFLNFLSYQVRVGLLNAGLYGTPQNRRRFFILAADKDHTLPAFPHPTHAFPDSLTLRINALPDGRPAWAVQEGVKSDTDSMRNPPLCIPHNGVTVTDAIRDLQPFNWSAREVV